MRDIIYRQDAIEAQEAYMAENTLDGYEDGCSLIDILKNLPSAQPDSPELDKLFGELKEKYEWAKQQEWILKPLGYALYYVWKEYDERGELL